MYVDLISREPVMDAYYLFIHYIVFHYFLTILYLLTVLLICVIFILKIHTSDACLST